MSARVDGLGIRGRFVAFFVLLVVMSAGPSAWSAWEFRRVSLAVDAAVRDSERTTVAAGALASSLEREDDALLLTLSDRERGLRELASSRDATKRALARVDEVLTEPGERASNTEIVAHVAAYHLASDALANRAHDSDARTFYHEQVNPLLRHAVGKMTHLRDLHFRSAQEVAVWARDRTKRATLVLIVVFASALIVSLVVAFYLARAVVLPIDELTRAVFAIRQGDFSRRVSASRRDELGRLAEGFNRMADDLDAFRRANIGEVIRAKETLEATLSALPDAVVVVEEGGAVSSVNPRADAMLHEVKDAPVRTLSDLSLPETTVVAVERALRGDVDVSRSVDLSKAITVKRESESRKLLPRIVPIEPPEGSHRAVVLLLSDVTNLVRLDEMRMELVAVASHELRTPLTTLRMTLLMLEERSSELDRRSRELLATALLGVEQLSAIVDEFLDLTRIEAGLLHLQWDRVDTEPLLARAVRFVKPTCEGAGIELRCEIDPDAPSNVWGDASRLSVVLSNVLGNAAKYAPPGSTIRVHASRAEVSGAPFLCVAIEDEGPGVPEPFREQIFDKFFRVEHLGKVASRGVRGSGIGLYVAREIVQAHGGTIEYVPELSKAVFAVRIPVERTRPPADEGRQRA